MNKVLLTCLYAILLLVGAMVALMFFSSKAIAQGDGIIVDGADYISTTTNEYSAELANITNEVTSRVVVEYGDFNSNLQLNKSDELNQVASTVTPRIIVEYADSIFEHVLESVTVPDIEPRIVVEYADSIFRTDLVHPLFEGEVSARIDSYSISPRDVMVGHDVTIGFSFTNTGNVSWTFGAGATLRKPDGTRIDFLKPVTVNPGESGSVQWTYTIDMAGRWDTVFGVWKESTHPLENLLVQTGWVDEYITATAIENQPPVADAGQDISAWSGDLVTFDGSNSYDPNPEGTIVSYRWNFSDGTTAEGKIVTHRFRGVQNKPKTYTVTLTVEDNNGAVDTDTVDVTVYPLRRTIKIFSSLSEFMSIPMPPIIEVIVYYNWVTEIEGQDEYIISKIHLDGMEGLGFTVYVFDIEDNGQEIWHRKHVDWWEGVEITFAYPFNVPRDSTLIIDGEHFRGLAVGPNSNLFFAAMGIELAPGPGGLGPSGFYVSRRIELGPGRQIEVPSIYPEATMAGILHITLSSPAELRVYDSQGRLTGLVKEEVKEEIPYSVYDRETKSVIVLAPTNSYRYEVVGTGEGLYSLTVTNITEQETATFNATDIPTSTKAIHEYTADWDALSRGEEGGTVKVDSDGDGVFELTFTSDSELTQDEFMLQLPPGEAFPMWMVGVAAATIAIATAAIAVFWRRRKQPPTKG